MGGGRGSGVDEGVFRRGEKGKEGGEEVIFVDSISWGFFSRLGKPSRGSIPCSISLDAL